jgi:hypothetical protein
MSYFPMIEPGHRAFRKQISHAVLTELIVKGRKTVSGSLTTISANGGCAIVIGDHQEGTIATIRVHTRVGDISAVAEILKSRKAGEKTEQAFRFLALEDEDYLRLQTILEGN